VISQYLSMPAIYTLYDIHYVMDDNIVYMKVLKAILNCEK